MERNDKAAAVEEMDASTTHKSTRSAATTTEDEDEDASCLAPDAVHVQDGNQQTSLFDEHYVLLPEVRGSGIAGEVRSCVNRRTSEVCAVKTMSKHRVRCRDRIDREKSTSQHHANVRRV